MRFYIMLGRWSCKRDLRTCRVMLSYVLIQIEYQMNHIISGTQSFCVILTILFNVESRYHTTNMVMQILLMFSILVSSIK